LSRPGIAGRFYTFEYVDMPGADAWQAYPFEIPGTDAPEYTGGSRFYQVKIRK